MFAAFNVHCAKLINKRQTDDTNNRQQEDKKARTEQRPRGQLDSCQRIAHCISICWLFEWGTLRPLPHNFYKHVHLTPTMALAFDLVRFGEAQLNHLILIDENNNFINKPQISTANTASKPNAPKTGPASRRHAISVCCQQRTVLLIFIPPFFIRHSWFIDIICIDFCLSFAPVTPPFGACLI